MAMRVMEVMRFPGGHRRIGLAPPGTVALLGAGAATDAPIRIPPGSAGSDVDGDLLKGGSLDEDVPAEKANFLGADERLRPG